MSKRTLAKRLRGKHAIIGYRDGVASIDAETKQPVIGKVPIPGRLLGYMPPAEAQIQIVKIGEIEMNVRIAPGQRINVKKEFARQRAAGLV